MILSTFFELILKHKKNDLKIQNNKSYKKNKFYEWFFQSWTQKFENAVSLTDEFNKEGGFEVSSQNHDLIENNYSNSIAEQKANLHFEKFIKILLNAEELINDEKQKEIKNIFKNDFESFGFGNTSIN